MKFDELKDALIICPNDFKNKLLESFSNDKKIYDIKFLTLEEYKRNYYFDYDIKAIKELTNSGLSPSNAKEILSNLYYVEDKKYNNEKLDKLVEYKKLLDSKNLLIYNKLFKQYLLTRNVIVLGYGKLNSFDSSIISGKTVQIIENEEKQRKYTINSFNDIEEEVEFVYNSIYDLLEKGIDINNIYVMNASNDYNAYFKRFNKYYGFNIEEKPQTKLIGTKLAEDVIDMLDTRSKEDIYDYLSDQESVVANKLIAIINKYAEFELNEVKQLIINDIKNSSFKEEYNNIIKNIKIFSCINNDDYVFFIGFNDLTPTMNRDTDYITDNIKSLVNIPTTEELNELRKENFKSYISTINNLTLSYCKNSPFNTYNKQILFNNDNCEYIENKNNKYYSQDLNKAKYSDKLDKLRKFNFNSNDIDKLYNTYGKNNYLSYNNKFNGLSDKQIDNITKQIHNKDTNDLTLSYSSMNSFCECNFKYYLDNVLKIKEPFGNYYTKLGTVCHGVLEELYEDKEFDFEKAWNHQIEKEESKENKNIFEDECEKHFVEKIKNELRQDIEIVKTQKTNSLLDNQKCENNFSFKVEDRINFIGFIDKVMYKEADNEIIASVVDYKTSKSIEIDKDIMKFGLSLQLPSYLYLMKHSKEFDKTIKFAGLYIQHIINYDNKYKDEETLLSDIKAESMKLDGISSVDVGRMQASDLSLTTGQKSLNIKGITVNKDGSLRKSAKLYTDEQFDELSNIVENSIKSAGNAILKGDFSINPKEINGENKSCAYCKYAPICYKRASDLVYLETDEQEEQ